MIEAISQFTSALGLSGSAGMNAYMPLLALGLAARYTNLVKLNEPWDVLTNGWVLLVLAVLLLVELTVDKIPAVDSINDMIQTFIRPAAGAVVFAAQSNFLGEIHPGVALIAGLLVAGGVHAAKTTARPVVTASTAGVGNPVISTIEDVVALILTVLSILVPIVAAVVFIGLLFWFWRWRRRRRVHSATTAGA